MWGSLAAMRVGLTVAELLADVKSQEHPCEKQGSPGSAAPGALLGGTRVRVPKRLWVGELFASQVLFCFMEPPSPGCLEDLRGLDPGLTQRTRNPGDLDCSKAPTSWESYPTSRHLIHTGEPLTAPGI